MRVHRHRLHNDKSAVFERVVCMAVVDFVGIHFRSQHQVGSLILICDSVRNTFFPLLRTRLGRQLAFLLSPIFRFGVLALFFFGIVLVELKIFVFFTVYLRRISVESKTSALVNIRIRPWVIKVKTSLRFIVDTNLAGYSRDFLPANPAPLRFEQSVLFRYFTATAVVCLEPSSHPRKIPGLDPANHK